MTPLEISLLGEVSIRRDGARLAVASAKALELLGYLLTHRTRPLTRDAVAAALWPGEDSRLAKRQLRQALWKLNAALTQGRSGGSGLLTAPRAGWLGVDPAGYARLDVQELEAAHALATGTRGQLAEPDFRTVEAAVGRYRGDFLAGWQQEWCLPERTRLQEAYLELLEWLVGDCDRRRLPVRGLHYGRLALALDPARESTHRRLMQLHHRAGDRPALARQYQQCAQALDEELGVPPSAETAALYQRLCAPDPAVPAGAQVSAPSMPTPATTIELAALHQQVDDIQAHLEALVRLIRRRADAVILTDTPESDETHV